MAFDIKKLYDSVKGARKDWKEDWKEDAKADWKFDFDAVVGSAPGVAPANTDLPVISGTPAVGETLTVNTGTWTGNPTPTFTYQWTLDGVDIGGATTNSYVVQAGDSTKDIAVEVTGTNSVGAATVTTAEVLVA